jgi:hypothetical protein
MKIKLPEVFVDLTNEIIDENVVDEKYQKKANL